MAATACCAVAVVGSQLKEIRGMVERCAVEQIEISANDIARMRDGPAYQRYLLGLLATRTAVAMIAAIFASFKPQKSVWKKPQYTEFVRLVADYEDLSEARWTEECKLLGAAPNKGISLEVFSRLYQKAEDGTSFRVVKEDYHKLFVG